MVDKLAGVLVLILLCGVVTATTTTHHTYYVSPTGSDSNPGTMAAPFATLEYTVGKCVSGDVIEMLPGTFTGYGNSNVMVPYSITVVGTNGSGSTFIVSHNTGAVIFTVASKVHLVVQGVTFQGCTSISASYTSTNVVLDECVFIDAPLNIYGNLTIQSSLLTASDPGSTTVLTFDDYTLLLRNSTFNGVVYIYDASLEAVSCTFLRYTQCSNCDAQLESCTSSKMQEYLYFSGGSVNFTSCSLGPVQVVSSEAGFTDCSFLNCEEGANSLLLFNGYYHNPLAITNCTFYNNTASTIVLVESSASVQIRDTRFTANQASSSVLDLSGSSSSTLENVQLSGNVASAAVFVQYPAYMSACYFEDNNATGEAVIVVSNTALLEVESSSFVNNHGAHYGVISASEDSLVSLTDSSFVSNTAQTYGAVVSLTYAGLKASRTQFYYNEADRQGGVCYCVTGGSSCSSAFSQCHFDGNVPDNGCGAK